MKKLLAAAVLLAALAAFAVASAAADTGGTDRPFTATMAGAAWAVPDSSCLTYPYSPGVRTHSEASGVASHLGLVSMTGSHCPLLDGRSVGGQMTLVAANGDELYMTFEGVSDPVGLPPPGTVITFTSDNVIVGGTGRFANATGEVHETVLVTFTGLGTPWPFTRTSYGTLSY
jgi:hypothetical protein